MTEAKPWRTALGLQSVASHTPSFESGFSATTFYVYRWGGVFWLDVYDLKCSSSKTYNTTSVTVAKITNNNFKPAHHVFSTVKLPNHYIGRLTVTSDGEIAIRYVSNGTAYYSGTGGFYGSAVWVNEAL